MLCQGLSVHARSRMNPCARPHELILEYNKIKLNKIGKNELREISLEVDKCCIWVGDIPTAEQRFEPVRSDYGALPSVWILFFVPCSSGDGQVLSCLRSILHFKLLSLSLSYPRAVIATGCVEFAMPLIDVCLLRLARGQLSFPQRGASECCNTKASDPVSSPFSEMHRP